MDRVTPEWTSYFLTGTVAVVLSWVFTGCQFGNGGGGGFKLPDTSTYYYETEADSLTYCALLEGQEDPQCGSLSTARVPGWARDLVSNPVGIQMIDERTRRAAIFNPFAAEPIGLETAFDERTGAIAHEQDFGTDPFWFADKSCLSSFLLAQEGAVARYEQSVVVSEKKVGGRLSLDFYGLTHYEGSGCADAFAEIQACHQDAAQCGEGSSQANQNLHDAVVAMFSAYVDSGAVSPADIHRIVALGYQVSYR